MQSKTEFGNYLEKNITKIWFFNGKKPWKQVDIKIKYERRKFQ